MTVCSTSSLIRETNSNKIPYLIIILTDVKRLITPSAGMHVGNRHFSFTADGHKLEGNVTVSIKMVQVHDLQISNHNLISHLETLEKEEQTKSKASRRNKIKISTEINEKREWRNNREGGNQ